MIRLIMENAALICQLCGLDSLRVVIDGKVYRYVRRR